MIKFLLVMFLSVTLQCQTVTFDDQEYGSNDLLSNEIMLDDFTFMATNNLVTNYGSYKNVDEVSLYFYFNSINTDYIMISSYKSFDFESLLAYQVSERENHSLVATGFKSDTVKYRSTFTNVSSWQILELNFIDIDSVKFNIEGEAYLVDYNFDDFCFNGIIRSVKFINIRR